MLRADMFSASPLALKPFVATNLYRAVIQGVSFRPFPSESLSFGFNNAPSIFDKCSFKKKKEQLVVP